MQQLILNDFYSDYLLGHLSRSELEGCIYTYLVNNQEKTSLNHWKHEDYDDYISWFYPRLQKAIDSYQDVGSTFEGFIARFLLISSKEYRTKMTTNAITEYSAWSALVPDMYAMYAREEPPVYIPNSAEDVITKLTIDRSGRKNTRRVLTLILKCYYYVSDDFAEKIAPKLGIKKTELLDMLYKIRSSRQKKDDDIFLMKEGIHTQFIRCLVYERRLSYIEENANAYSQLKLKLKKARERLEKMRKRLTSIRTEATNKQIAEIIGISKGTVDASLHRLKGKWAEMSKKAVLN